MANAFLAGVQLLAVLTTMETELNDLIARDEEFGKWYFESLLQHNTYEPERAYQSYRNYVRQTNEEKANRAFAIKMVMRKHGWDEEYFENEPTRLKNLAFEMNRRDGDEDNLRTRAETEFMEMLPYKQTDDFRQALQHQEQFMRELYGDEYKCRSSQYIAC